MANLVGSLNEMMANLVGKLGLNPSSYLYMFPTTVDPETIMELVDKKFFPVLTDLAPALTYALMLGAARFLLERFIFKPLAKMAMRVREVPFVPSQTIEIKLPVNKPYSKNELQRCARELAMTERDLAKYLWVRRRSIAVQKQLVKFSEAFWRFLFYFTFCVVGYRTLFLPEKSPWVVDTSLFFRGWPLDHRVSVAVQFYYQIELGAYLHQLMWTEVSRSDAMQMIVHHCVTILLIVGSFLTNFTRIGSYILLLHDVADIFLEGAKVLNYSSIPKAHRWIKSTLTDPLFAVFTVTFFVSRLLYYPYYVLRGVFCSINFFPAEFQCYPEQTDIFHCDFVGCFAYIGLLSILQVLHIFWFYLIGCLVYRLVTVGSAGKDIRESDEEDFESTAYPEDDETAAPTSSSRSLKNVKSE